MRSSGFNAYEKRTIKKVGDHVYTMVLYLLKIDPANFGAEESHVAAERVAKASEKEFKLWLRGG